MILSVIEGKAVRIVKPSYQRSEMIDRTVSIRYKCCFAFLILPCFLQFFANQL